MSASRKFTIAALALCAVLSGHGARAQSFKSLYIFDQAGGGVDGVYPNELTFAGGMLYGTTQAGGKLKDRLSCGCGISYKIDPETGKETVLHRFGNTAHDGQLPNSGLLEVGGTLYGSTEKGGKQGRGTIFSLDPETGEQAIVSDFDHGNAGSYPAGTLTWLNGALYGFAHIGGFLGQGTIFKVDPATGDKALVGSLRGFNNYDLAPTYIGGSFYDVAELQGSHNQGFLFKLEVSTGAQTILHNFRLGDRLGQQPSTRLIVADGALYGTAYLGGSNNAGVIFKLDPKTGRQSVIYDFQGGADGGGPDGLTYHNGVFYGCTSDGGSGQSGTLYAFNPKTHVKTILHSFTGEFGGQTPYKLIYQNGRLFGLDIIYANGGAVFTFGIFRLTL